jgi:DnaK suppressor protein
MKAVVINKGQSKEKAAGFQESAVDDALKRISEGTFGQCLNREQEINAKRLEAIPWVRYCITCQDLMDRTK